MSQSVLASGCALLALTFAAHARAACGDGTVESGEGCDDGNTALGDGCGVACDVESGFGCRSQARVAVANASFESVLSSADWELVTGSVDRVDGLAFSGCSPAGEGQFSIDMNGSTRGELAQTLTTVPGTRYTVFLLGSANCIEVSGQPCNRTCTKTLTISASDAAAPTAPFTVTTYDLNGSSQPSAGGWTPIRFEFTAATASTRLLLSGSDPSFAGPMVDAFAIPESVCAPDLCGNGAVEIGEVCDDGNTEGGDGCSSDCTLGEKGWGCPVGGGACTPTCGDGIKVSAEACDDGGTADADGCSALCAIEPGFTCIVDALNTVSVCTATCGNGNLDPGEACDETNGVDQDACSNTCLLGPGEPCIIDGQCALGACTASACDGCYDTQAGGTDFGCAGPTPHCFTGGAAPICVECVSDGDCSGGALCLSQVCSRCGDGALDSGETCDDGNREGGDGCSSTCAPEPGYVCQGQAPVPLVNGSFEDDFVNAPGGWLVASGSVDRVSSTADGACWPPGLGEFSVDLNGSTRGELTQSFPTVAGTRYVVGLLGSANCREQGPDSCLLSCSKVLTISTVEPGVGPLAVTSYSLEGSPQAAGWKRIHFAFTATGTTTELRFSGSDPSLAGPMIDDVSIAASVCALVSCGDGSLSPGEACDDGNTNPGDGCSADCTVEEHGHDCSTPGQLCTATCGDGIKVPREPCDDGNTDPGDGCTGSCTIEPGFECIVDPLDIVSLCVPVPDGGGPVPDGGGPVPDGGGPVPDGGGPVPDGGSPDGAAAPDGAAGSGGASSTGGAPSGTGGSAAGGGPIASSGGVPGTGGAVATGGRSSAGGTSTEADAGDGPNRGGGVAGGSFWSCSARPLSGDPPWTVTALALAAAAFSARRRRRG